MAQIRFFYESVDFAISHPSKVSRWIKKVITTEAFIPGNLNVIFCNDEGLREINIIHLNHPTFTDIITFDHSEEPGVIEGDIFISIDRVKENARHLAVSFEDELHRVIIHGVLHLIGYQDKRPADRKEMRQKEDDCLSLRDVPRGTIV